MSFQLLPFLVPDCNPTSPDGILMAANLYRFDRQECATPSVAKVKSKALQGYAMRSPKYYFRRSPFTGDRAEGSMVGTLLMLGLVVAMVPGMYMLRSHVTSSMDDTRTLSEESKEEALVQANLSEMQAVAANAMKTQATNRVIEAQARADEANVAATCFFGSPNPCMTTRAYEYEAWRGPDGQGGYYNEPWECTPPNQVGVVQCTKVV